MGSFCVSRSGRSPEGRRELPLTALVVRPTENGGRCADTCSGAIFFCRAIPGNSGQFRAILSRSEQSIVGNSGQGSSDLAAGAAVRAAVFGCATLSHQRPTERPFRHLICDQDAPSMRLGRSSSARSTRASCAAWFDRTNAPRARQPGAAWGRRADRSLPGRVGRGGPGRSRRAGGERACRPGLPAPRRTNFVGDAWT